MNSDLEENLSITLSKAAWLVLFELLATSNAEWNKTNPDSYSTSAKPLQLKADHPERVALWWLECALESRLSEPMLGNYAELVEEASACEQQLIAINPHVTHSPRDHTGINSHASLA